MYCLRKLQVECRIVLGFYELAVGFFAHFDALNRITPRSQVANLGSGIFGRIVEYRDRCKHRQTIGEPALKDSIESWLFY